MLRIPVLFLSLAVVGCTAPAASTESIDLPEQARHLDDITCDTLVTDSELTEALSISYLSLGRRASSCYWASDDGLVQLVINTGTLVERWRDELLKTYTDQVPDQPFETWAEPGTNSIAMFAPGRGLIIHGVTDRPRALTVLRLALPRL